MNIGGANVQQWTSFGWYNDDDDESSNLYTIDIRYYFKFFSLEVNHRFSSTCLQLSRNILLLECVNNTMLNLCRQNCKRDYNYVHTKYALKSTQINMFARSHYNATIRNFIYSLLLALSRWAGSYVTVVD